MELVNVHEGGDPKLLIACIASLLRDNVTQPLARELLGAHRWPEARSRYQTVALQYAYHYVPADIMARDQLMAVDWQALGRALPAVKSEMKLEALDDERLQLSLKILYTLTAVSSFILNVITVIVLSRYQRGEMSKYLINLSLSDLLMSLFSIRKYDPAASGTGSGPSTGQLVVALRRGQNDNSRQLPSSSLHLYGIHARPVELRPLPMSSRPLRW